jgi:hypothetical protein
VLNAARFVTVVVKPSLATGARVSQRTKAARRGERDANTPLRLYMTYNFLGNFCDAGM